MAWLDRATGPVALVAYVALCVGVVGGPLAVGLVVGGFFGPVVGILAALGGLTWILRRWVGPR